MNQRTQPNDKFTALRKRAEEALANGSIPITDTGSLEDIRTLISELHIHQIELEMQNEELHKSQSQIALERKKYADLYNFAPVAYFSVDNNDVILDLNIAAADLLGHEPRYLIERPITPYLTPDSLQVFIQHRISARELQLPQDCELTIRRRDGSHIIVQAHTAAMENKGTHPVWRSVMTDITERKNAESQLRRQASWSRFISDAVIATDQDLLITSWNEAATTIYGWNREEAIGQHIDALLKTEFLEASSDETQSLLAKNGVWRGMLRQSTRDGTALAIEASVTFLKDDAGKIIGGVTVNRDITERKKSEESLQKANERLSIQLAEIQQLQAELQEQAIRDHMTGVYNRRYLQDAYKREFSRMVREGASLSIVMFDLDDLKGINDQYGHHAGDEALRSLAHGIQSMIRAEDVICRSGGDEFIVLMSRMTAESARARVEEWRETLNAHPLVLEGKEIQVRFTAGISSYPQHSLSMEELINYADVALYRAKAKGRNCTAVFE